MQLRAAVVAAVGRDEAHTFSKPPRASIRLVASLGVQGDAHAGRTVRHRSRVARDPTAPNLRQVHLIPAGLRNPCTQLDGFRPGLMRAVLDRDADGGLGARPG